MGPLGALGVLPLSLWSLSPRPNLSFYVVLVFLNVLEHVIDFSIDVHGLGDVLEAWMIQPKSSNLYTDFELHNSANFFY